MGVMRGHEDLRLKQVVGWADGKVMVKTDDGIERYDAFVTPHGTMQIRPPAPVPIDQHQPTSTQSTEQRWATSGIDQGQS